MSHYTRRLSFFLALGVMGGYLFASSPAGAQMGTTPILEKPPAAEAKKEESPTTCGPLISDSCIPIETHHASLQVLWGLAMVYKHTTTNWRQDSAGGNSRTFFMPVKFTYGPIKDLEMYAIIPFINNWVFDSVAIGPNGERSASYAGVGDITAMAKYLLLPETDWRPAVTGAAGVGFPSGHAHHLNPVFLGQDAVGSGAFTFTTGVNLYKWLKPFLVYSNIWLNTPINLYPSRDDAVRSREFVTFNLAAEYPISKKWVALMEFYSTWTWTNISTPQGFQSPSTILGLLPGIEYFITEKWALSAGTAVDLAGKAGSLKVTPLLTAYYNF